MTALSGSDHGSAGAGWDRMGVGGEERKNPKGKNLVKTLRTDISSLDKHGYRCTSRCSISQVN